MLADILKFFFIFYLNIYICFKMMQHSLSTMFTKIIYTIFSITLASLTHFLGLYFDELKYIIPLILIWFFVSIFTTKPQITFVAVTIAFGISYSLHAISSFIIITTTYIIYGNFQTLPYFTLAVLSSIFQILLVLVLFRIKRFNKGLTCLLTNHLINIATIVCLLFIAFSVYVNHNQIYSLGILSFVFLLAFLIYWWQAQITKSYKHSLELRELESLRTEVTEKDKLIAELTVQNKEMGRLIHKDNKLLGALKSAVCDYLVSDFTDTESVRNAGESLLNQIEDKDDERTSQLAKISAKKCTQHTTGVPKLDTLLNYYEKRAIQDKISFAVHIAAPLEKYIPQTISEEDLVHVLSDLLENAFIATRTCTSPSVQLQFYQLNKHFVIEVADNGVSFETASLVNMGLVQLTTHGDTGGTGTGLMDIWMIKERYRATLHIEEHAEPTPFSKKISLTFNRKNLYSVRTWRKDEIAQMSERIDLQVYDYQDS